MVRRSTKAGAFTPATRGGAVRRSWPVGRSTKAGAFTPATPPRRSRARPWQPPRNEGRGVHPGDTPSPPSRYARLTFAQRRPGRSPRRHIQHSSASMSRCSAQRRPGRSPRRHACSRDTPSCANGAQRRPERSPRRHLEVVRRDLGCRRRSTKAGAFTPATLAPGLFAAGRHERLNEGRSVHPGDTGSFEPDWPGIGVAQRRPERSPRRHPARGRGAPPGPSRSTKAGAFTPATRGTSSCEHARYINRSTKAGAFTPATQVLSFGQQPLPLRSTKAGAFTPATPRWSTTSGRGGSAQRRPERSPRRHVRVVGCLDGNFDRSTKAGAFTPATPPARPARASSRRPLNEGRSVDPGDTPARRAPASRASALNEGRSVHPGDTSGCGRPPPRTAALNEGRSVHPGDTRTRSG